MTKDEIVAALLDDIKMPYLKGWQAHDIVYFVLKKYTEGLPSNLDEAANDYIFIHELSPSTGNHPWVDAFKAGAEWMSGQGVTKDAVIGMATEEISINVSQQTLDELDLCPGDKVVVQIRKK